MRSSSSTPSVTCRSAANTMLDAFRRHDLNPPNSQRSGLLSLPPEIRSDIFGYALGRRRVEWKMSHVPNNGPWDLPLRRYQVVKLSNTDHDHENSVALLQTCQCVYQEARSVLFDQSQFSINLSCDGFRLRSSYELLVGWLNPSDWAQDLFDHVKHLEIQFFRCSVSQPMLAHLHHPRGSSDFQQRMDTINRMVLWSKLKTFNIIFHEDDASRLHNATDLRERKYLLSGCRNVHTIVEFPDLRRDEQGIRQFIGMMNELVDNGRPITVYMQGDALENRNGWPSRLKGSR